MPKFIVTLVFILLLTPSTKLLAAEGCTNCHEEVLAKGRNLRFVHDPFQQGQCEQCHIVGQAVSVPVKKSPLKVEKEQLETIRWFQTVGGKEQEHWVRLPAKILTGGLYVKASDGRMRSPLQKISPQFQATLPQKIDDLRPPIQSGLKVADVRRGISTTATLVWETDEFTESVIYYGVDNLRSVTNDSLLAKQHSQVLVGLDSDKSYQYQVVSRDLFGNESKSAVQIFSTDKSFWDQDAQYDNSFALQTEVELSWDLFRVQNDYLVVFQADRPVSLSLGTENKIVNEATAERQVATTGSFTHPILKSSFDTNMTVCKSCHLTLRDSYSHPINVRPRGGMIIPPEYPLLPDGKISCMSCHANHASNHEYRLIKPGKAELCRGCHKNY